MLLKRILPWLSVAGPAEPFTDVALALLGVASGKIQCIGEHDKPVDWWFIYKLPALSGSDETKRGFAYAYMDSAEPKLTIQSHTLDQITGNALGNTLHQVYTNKKSKDMGWIMYNDQPPQGKFSGSRGHAKGSVGYDGETGFWLVHSTPRFPDLEASKFDFPEHERIYAQTFMCLSVKNADVENIAQQIALYFPGVYASNLPKARHDEAPTMQDLIDGKNDKTKENTESFKTVDGIVFKSYAKSSKSELDLWGEVIAKAEKVDMYVQTWRRDPYFDSFCRPKYAQNAMNIDSLKIDDIEWNYTQDHSKWGVASEHGTLVCVGDINRMPSQLKRGGGAVCVHNAKLHDALLRSVNEYTNCKNKKTPRLRGSDGDDVVVVV